MIVKILTLAAVLLLLANFSLVMADHEASIPDPNNDIMYFVANIMPACDFYKNMGVKKPGVDCSEWFQTHEGNLLIMEYLMNRPVNK